MPMCRRISGSTPWPMLPKPMNRIRPGNSRRILSLLLMMRLQFSLCATQARGYEGYHSRGAISALAFLSGRSAPVRRIGALVAGEGRDARERAAERREVHVQRAGARGQRERLAAYEWR